jgi:hypothetical protein
MSCALLLGRRGLVGIKDLEEEEDGENRTDVIESGETELTV